MRVQGSRRQALARHSPDGGFPSSCCAAGGESLVEIRREPQIVGGVEPQDRFVQPSRAKQARHLCRAADPLADARDAGVDRRGRRLRGRHSPHLVQHQHTIDDSGQTSGNTAIACRRLDQPKIERRFHIGQRDDLTGQDGGTRRDLASTLH